MPVVVSTGSPARAYSAEVKPMRKTSWMISQRATSLIMSLTMRIRGPIEGSIISSRRMLRSDGQ